MIRMKLPVLIVAVVAAVLLLLGALGSALSHGVRDDRPVRVDVPGGKP